MALGNLGYREGLAPLVSALKDRESGVRRLAIAALSRIDSHWSAAPEVREAADQLKAVVRISRFTSNFSSVISSASAKWNRISRTALFLKKPYLLLGQQLARCQSV